MRGRAVHMVLAGMAALGFAGAAWAQLRPGGGSGPRVDPSATVTVEGEVVSFQAGLGQGTPELVVREADGSETSFVLGPFRYLESQGFVAQAGDRVEIAGYECANCESGVAVAQVKNLTRGLTLVLRNADGTPVWIAFGGQNLRRHLGTSTPAAGNGGPQAAAAAQGMGSDQGTGSSPNFGRHLCDGNGPDLSRVASFTGTVVSFTGGPGEGTPTLVLGTVQGDLSILVSPYRTLVYSGYVPVAGAQVEMKAAPVELDGQEQWLALSVKDLASGLVVVLRNAETGLPVIMGGGGWR
jgi:hypothetical protein